ncbi:ABC transporter permease [Spongisporangium articulatum]|uniref:ABC transporter permease n=1 Tax=Spongisporangium articulatum TaxID=3362603 RepID=A0ABW8ALH7_9ACTN
MTSGTLAKAGRNGLTALVVLGVWEVVGRLALIGDGALPAPTAIVAAFWRSRSDYPQHVLATVEAAGAGFVLGNLVAVALAVLYVLVPGVERAGRSLMVALFCLPVVVVAPILAIALPGDWPKITLAALSVFFPTLVSTVQGLRHAPGDALGVVTSAGGGFLRQLWLVRVRAAVPDLLSGLQVAAPAAMLGALLGEFMGSNAGLGVYLLGSLGRADPPTLWAIGLVATAISATAYGLFGLLRRALSTGQAEALQVFATEVRARPQNAGQAALSGLRVLAWTAVSLAVVVGAWYAFIRATGLPSMLMNSPADVWRSLVTGPHAADVRADLLPTLRASLLDAALGSLAGIGTAFVLAVGLSLLPAAGRAVMPFAFLSQTMPIVALTPLIALVFGRGTLTITVVTVSVTFFPALVTVLGGLERAPTGPLAVLDSVAAGPFTTLRLVTVPNALPHLLTAVRLAAPRALTGVLLAEQFVTGTGLGGLLGHARGFLDYRMMWVIAATVALVSVVVYMLAEALEWQVLRRRT